MGSMQIYKAPGISSVPFTMHQMLKRLKGACYKKRIGKKGNQAQSYQEYAKKEKSKWPKKAREPAIELQLKQEIQINWSRCTQWDIWSGRKMASGDKKHCKLEKTFQSAEYICGNTRESHADMKIQLCIRPDLQTLWQLYEPWPNISILFFKLLRFE